MIGAPEPEKASASDSLDRGDESYGHATASEDDMPVLDLPTTFSPDRIAAVVAVLAAGIARQIVADLGMDQAMDEGRKEH